MSIKTNKRIGNSAVAGIDAAIRTAGCKMAATLIDPMATQATVQRTATIKATATLAAVASAPVRMRSYPINGTVMNS
jgi:hypothetical protein